MSVKTITAIGLALVTITLPLPAQEMIDFPRRDQHLNADFEEVFHPVPYCAWISGTKTCKPTPLSKAGCLPLVTKTPRFRGTSGCRGMPRGP